MAGADPETGELPSDPETESITFFDGVRNSRDLPEDRVVTLVNIELPALDFQDPATRIKDTVAIALSIGGNRNIQDTVPVDPNDFLSFEAPEKSCPCPDPSAPACQ